MKKLTVILTIMLIGLVSCKKEALPGAPCTVTVNVFTGDLVTKAVSPGDGEVPDGGGIAFDDDHPDLKILIADETDAVVARYLGTGSNLQEGATATQMSVTFDGLTAGPYTVYAFANTSGLWNIEGGVDWSAVSTGSALEALEFTPLSPVEPLAVQSGRLPMSAKGSLRVSSGGTGEISLQMIRCVAKVTMDFVNRTGERLTLDDFTFSLENLCPDRGFVSPHALPDVPAGITYGDIVHPDEDGISLDPGAVQTYSFYVFPGTALPRTRDYLLNASFRPNGAAVPQSYSDLPVHDDHAVNIVSLERNQHLHIVTRISRGLTVSFNFEVSDWVEKTESVLFR